MNQKQRRFVTDKKVLVYGATGGIGEAVVELFHRNGATVIAGGRNKEKLDSVRQRIGLNTPVFEADFTDWDSLNNGFLLLDQLDYLPDIVIVAAGRDNRRSFHQQSAGELRESLSVNLIGPALLARAVVPYFLGRGWGTFLVIGGFGDGRLAFPYHSPDVAGRAGVTAMFESLNREYRNIPLQFRYYCPPAVTTDTEDVFLPLWRKLGVSIISPEQAAKGVLITLMGKRSRWMTGSGFDRFGVRLNAVSPETADAVFMGKMSRIMKEYFEEGAV